MNEETFNISLRKFLKMVGVSSQREIEQAVQRAIDGRAIKGGETFPATMRLEIAGLNVPAGTYTLYVLVKDPENWRLIVNKQTGQNGDSYDASMDLGRVDMKTEKPQAPVEKLKYTITASGNTGKLQLEWENHIASVTIRAK